MRGGAWWAAGEAEGDVLRSRQASWPRDCRTHGFQPHSGASGGEWDHREAKLVMARCRAQRAWVVDFTQQHHTWTPSTASLQPLGWQGGELSCSYLRTRNGWLGDARPGGRCMAGCLSTVCHLVLQRVVAAVAGPRRPQAPLGSSFTATALGS